ncbi:carbohydrate ABC transporter permease [Leifsonia sp. 21MFCrub1.1]|uniref:carbohydrate ABC transporter permease n=1 Tax=Leifsonia sp. 21MFCrub1.1 TaxID=1798223 RepID=UPI0008929ECE|nr:sugar ABC transporter permease [Leifsonia sp. 21MFCrub1.1]SEB07945.1 carbohydrate ABC transporter membrane protein 1, CUT1 family [Leifsonia sp. 21MFCrub1.1]
MTVALSKPRKGRSSVPARLKDIAGRWSFMIPATVVLVAVLAYPLLYTLQISFSHFDLSTFSPGSWVGLENYTKALGNESFQNSLLVTGIYLVLALPLQIVLGFAIAFLLNAEWRGRGVFRALFLIPMVVAPVVSGGIWKMLLDPLWGVVGWVGSLVGLPTVDWFGSPVTAMISVVLIDTWRSVPFVVLIASAALLSLPKDVFEAAQVDGANWWQTLWRVSLPMLAPIIAATFIVRWLGAVKMFDIVLTTTNGGPGKATEVVNLYIYQQAFQLLRFSESSAMAVIVLVLTTILTLVFLWGSKKLEDRV